MESSRQIEDRGAAWLAQRDRDNWTEADQAELSAWLNASTSHRVAFLRLEAGWEKSSRLKVFGVKATSGHVPPRGRLHLSAFFSRQVPSRHVPGTGASGLSGLSRTHRFTAKRRMAFAIAATALLVFGTGAYITLHAPGDRYSTPVGGVASIPLRDGSQITLNTASKIRVALTESERHIELQSGEAFFSVAKDPARPFVVEAGNRRVIAVGTQFSVRRNADNDIQVVVTEGKVRVENRDSPGPSETNDPGTMLVAAGGIAHAGPNEIHTQNQPLPKIEEVLSWRTGYLTFDEVSLADAVAEFNRYNRQKIYIEDLALANLRISGKFRATNSSDFIHLLRTGFAIQIRQTDDSTYLVAN